MYFEQPSNNGNDEYSDSHYHLENVALIMFVVAAFSSIKANELHLRYRNHPTEEYKRKVYELGLISAFLIMVASLYFFMDGMKHYEKNTSKFKKDYLTANALNALGGMLRYAGVVQETPEDFPEDAPF